MKTNQTKAFFKISVLVILVYLTFHPYFYAVLFNSSLAVTPSISDIDVDQESSSYGLDRRNSSGTLLSPEIDVSAGTTKTVSGGDTNEGEGFYLLKKDSQRRATLFKVLTQDKTKICDVWMLKIEAELKDSVKIKKVLFCMCFSSAA